MLKGGFSAKTKNWWNRKGYFTGKEAKIIVNSARIHPIQVAWTSRNAGPVKNRTVSASLYNMFVQVSGMTGADIYQPDDAPRYFKAKQWDAMTPEQQHDYRANTTDKGNKA
ncbi:hypothetical protein LX36DRAFT_713902 [Colletotrichum falcatum]|nr:hypothetical protein LX36DRAFT_713902 [Colletotrichum falcatum]